MAHGYLGEGYGTHGEFDPDRGDDRDRRRDEDDRRGMMFRDRDRDREHRAFGDYSSGRRSFSANPDDHYRSWRDRHMSELDRDYEDYCRERELQFHRDFDRWRRERSGNPQPLRTGMTQSGLSHDPTGELQLETEATAPVEPDPVADATLGTNSSGGPRSRR